MKASYETGVLYELARELIGGKMSLIAAELGAERLRSSIDTAKILQLKEQSSALFLEREELRSNDELAIRACIARHSRRPSNELERLL